MGSPIHPIAKSIIYWVTKLCSLLALSFSFLSFSPPISPVFWKAWKPVVHCALSFKMRLFYRLVHASCAAALFLVTLATDNHNGNSTLHLEKRYPKSEDGRCGVKFGTRCEDDEGCSSEGYVLALNTA